MTSGVVGALLVVFGLLLVGCSSPTEGEATVSARPTATSTAAATPAAADEVVVIDVRTPSEYAAGHLDGALNIDVQSATFGTQIDALDRGASYILYCRSGSRASGARETMLEAGFTDVTNAGGLSAAAKSTGLEIVQS